MSRKSRDYMELAKPKICFMALVMASLGYFWGMGEKKETLSFWHFLFSLMGIGLVGISACALNQLVEKELDAKMLRTRTRPLPSGRLKDKEVFLFGLLTGLIGFFVLLELVNSVTAVLGGFAILFYLAIYTPAKRQSSLSTLLGALPGAIPPLMGWTASYGVIGREGIFLFALLFLWQVPHFLALGWLYREDYARADVPILPLRDPDGRYTGLAAVLYTVALMVLSLVPRWWGKVGGIYLFGALFAGMILLTMGVWFYAHRSQQSARALFFSTLFYLPLLGILTVLDKT